MSKGWGTRLNYVRSLVVVLPRLKPFWLLSIVAGLCVVAVGLASGPATFRGQFTVFACGALIGFACSAYFSLENQFFLRGCRDLVYLVSNRTLRPDLYTLGNRETLNAFGGVWHEITHVSESVALQLFNLLGKGELNLKDAELYGVNGEASIFAVLLGTRYGIPNMPTLRRVWGESPKVTYIDVAQLDRLRPGRDLVSVQYWPEKDRQGEG